MSEPKFPGRRRSGSLVVVGFSHRDSQGHNFWFALCDCQKGQPEPRLTPVRQDHLRSRRVTSCGCRRRAEPTSVELHLNLENLTPEQLAELASNPEMRDPSRAEVCRRLKDDPRKANFLTFRWLLPANEEDKADAYDGLMRCCWRAMMKRLPWGLFPHGYPEKFWQRYGIDLGQAIGRAIREETREIIMTALVDRLYDFKGLSDGQIILTALNGGFRTAADVGNAIRQRVREESEYFLQYGDDVVWEDGKGRCLTLFDLLDNPNPEPASRRVSRRLPGNATEDPTQFVLVPVRARTNHYNEAVETILQEKSQVVEVLGEEGGEVLEKIVQLEDDHLLPEGERDGERALTGIFGAVYGVNERQACTLKSRFRKAFVRAVEAGKWVFEQVAELLGWQPRTPARKKSDG